MLEKTQNGFSPYSDENGGHLMISWNYFTTTRVYRPFGKYLKYG